MTADSSSSVSPQHWIRALAGDAPEPLLLRVDGILTSAAIPPGLGLVDALLSAGDILLASVLSDATDDGRGVALDLLAADACVTWAFEAAADEPGMLGARAEAAMQRIAAVGL